MTLIHNLLLFVAAASAAPASLSAPEVTSLKPRGACAGNTAQDRSVWCDYSIDTDWYTEVPDTGVTVEVILSILLFNTTLIIPVLARNHKHLSFP